MIYVGEQQVFLMQHRRDRIVVSTLRCGRNNPGSNPGHGTLVIIHHSAMLMRAVSNKGSNLSLVGYEIRDVSVNSYHQCFQ